MAAPIHLEVLADLFNKIGPLRPWRDASNCLFE